MKSRSIRNQRPDPPSFSGGLEAAKNKPPERMTMVERLRMARLLASEGKSRKHIHKKTLLDDETIRGVVAAAKGIELRKSHRETLLRNLAKLQSLLPLAEAAYEDSPTGVQARDITVLSSEIRAHVADLAELARPEAIALDLIQKVFQPFIRDIMKETMLELRRARGKCASVSESTEARQAVEGAFRELGSQLGVAFKERYGISAEQLGITLQCDLVELRKLAASSRATLEEDAAVD